MKHSLLAIFLLCSLPAQAGIEFDSTTVRVPALPTDDEVGAKFTFKITGDKPVRIIDITPFCKCLEASVEHAEYRPGQTGEVKLRFEIGSFEGEVTKQVNVQTNDPEKPSIDLYVTVDVPALYEFEPRTTIWYVGDPPDPKTVKVKVLWKDPINLLSVNGTRENVKPEIKTIKPGREYEIILTPKSTAEQELGLISIKTDCKIPKFASRQIFHTITNKRPALNQAPSPATPPNQGSATPVKPESPAQAPPPAEAPQPLKKGSIGSTAMFIALAASILGLCIFFGLRGAKE